MCHTMFSPGNIVYAKFAVHDMLIAPYDFIPLTVLSPHLLTLRSALRNPE